MEKREKGKEVHILLSGEFINELKNDDVTDICCSVLPTFFFGEVQLGLNDYGK